MPPITISSEDFEMIEKCVDMISMQCRMIGNMLRRSQNASAGSVTDCRPQTAAIPDSAEGMVDLLNSAVSTLSTTARHMSSEASPIGDPRSESRKRSRGRVSSVYAEAYDSPLSHAGPDVSLLHATTPPPTKRRGRPPRDYGEELGPAFAMYASEVYKQTELVILDRSGASPGARIPKNDVLRVVWENWWLSAQGLKDKYLTLSRHEMAVNETHMLELLLEYPLPSGALAAQASHRHAPQNNRSLSRSPELVSPYDVFLSEQIPLLRSKVPDWSDAEIQRRLSVNWNSMSPSDRDRYAAGPHASPSANGGAPARNFQAGAVHKLTPRARTQSAPRRAYVLFCRQERPVLVGDNPQWDLPTVNKELGRRWKDLTPGQRDVYYAMEKKEAESRASAAGGIAGGSNGLPYTSNPLNPHATTSNAAAGSSSVNHVPTYQKPGGYFAGVSTTPTNGRYASGSAQASIHLNGRPGSTGAAHHSKGPSKAYVFYSRVVRKTVSDSHPEWDLATINRELGRMWKALPTDERQMWESRAMATTNSGESVSSTPRRHESPMGYSHVLAIATGTTTPSPMPSTAAVSGENSNTSTPATPASGSATPMSRDDAALALLQHRNYDGESEAEDIEMQDDETESEYAHAQQNHSRAAASISAYPTSAHYSAAAAHDSATPEADRLLPKHGVQSALAPRPPPTAKPAAVGGGLAAATVDSSDLPANTRKPPSPKSDTS